MTDPRPKNIPRKIPLSWWHLREWIMGGRKGPRPPDAPRRTPPAFYVWYKWRLPAAQRAHAQHVKKTGHGTPKHRLTLRAKIVKHAKWGAAAKVSPQVHYTEDLRRDDWLVNDDPSGLPMWTDCSGWGTQCDYVAGAPDPNGLAYRYLGWTGTLVENATKYGTVTSDLSKALPGDAIVVGPGSGVHEFKCVEAGPDPLVSTHGTEGVQIIRASQDPREPKRVCRTLPA